MKCVELVKQCLSLAWNGKKNKPYETVSDKWQENYR